jgi:transcriptional regulator with XRE-family HTH domain
MEVPTFGSTLRLWRDCAAPPGTEVTRAGATVRRAPGLRREELAHLAGVSTDYLQRLEQDRAHPSPAVVRALARALDVTEPSTAELLRLAGHVPPAPRGVPRELSPGAQRLLTRFSDKPVGVYDATWTWMTGNAAWHGLFAHVPVPSGRAQNVVWLYFTGDTDFFVRADPDEHDRFLVASLRRAAQSYPDDVELAEMVSSLRGVSDRFDALWQAPQGVELGGHRGTVRGTAVGDLTLDWDVFSVMDTCEHIVVFSATPGGIDEIELAKLLEHHRNC